MSMHLAVVELVVGSLEGLVSKPPPSPGRSPFVLHFLVDEMKTGVQPMKRGPCIDVPDVVHAGILCGHFL